METLCHYGVKGMRWGIRRSRPKKVSTTSSQKPKPKPETSAQKSTPKPRPKSISEMSDDELRKRINRLQLEKQLNDLSPKKVSAGKAAVSRVLNKVILPAAEEAGKQLLKDQFLKLGTNAVAKASKKK